MLLIERFTALQVNELSTPKPDEMNYFVNKYQICRQKSEYTEECASVIEQHMKMKQEPGGVYGSFQ